MACLVRGVGGARRQTAPLLNGQLQHRLGAAPRRADVELAVQQIQSMPEVRDAVTEGQIPLANAKTLARASNRTSAGEVAQDEGLLEKAASLAPENFAREAGRWVARRQRDGGESEQHLSPEGDKAFAEIADGGAIPQSVLEEHFCNARIVGVVFSSKGRPLWRGSAVPRPTKAQMDALMARYGGCGGCGEHSVICQAHHIRPRSRGGPTNVDNLIPLCWGCHDKVHYHDWQVVPDGGLHTIEPPERIRHGPAHAPDPPLTRGPHRGGASDRHEPPMVTTGEHAETPSTSHATDPLFAAV